LLRASNSLDVSTLVPGLRILGADGRPWRTIRSGDGVACVREQDHPGRYVEVVDLPTIPTLDEGDAVTAAWVRGRSC
jgi:hypothetical protein